VTTAPLPSPRYRRVTLGLCTLWLVAVVLIVLTPSPVDTRANVFLVRALAALHRRGIPTWFDYPFVEFTANIVMFVPLGLFFFILAPRGWRWLGPLLGLLLSATIELTQLVVLPQRVATPYDVVANAFGALVGTVLAWVQLQDRGRRRRLPR
jgi:glycopeptide antibiotics resistance protein